MALTRRLLGTYAEIGRTYRAWAPTILLLALIVFVPLAAIDGLVAHVEIESIDLDSGFKVFALALAVGAITATGLLGEVFFSGAVAVMLTHPRGQRLPSLLAIARQLRYRRLIAVDVVYVLIVAIGLLLFIVPGALAFVMLGLAGPVVELEERGVRGALKRSWELVRGNFWFVLWVLVPIEVFGDALGEGIAGIVHAAAGHGFLASWLAETLSNVLLSPIFAVAAVLLTIKLIAAKDGEGPQVNRDREPAIA
jgi:hypothetical protein